MAILCTIAVFPYVFFIVTIIVSVAEKSGKRCNIALCMTIASTINYERIFTMAQSPLTKYEVN